MAVRFKDLGIRTLSAIVFSGLLLGSLFAGYLTFTLFFFVASIIGLFEFYRLSAAAGFPAHVRTGTTAGVLVYTGFVNWEVFTGTPLQLPVWHLISVLVSLFLVVSLWSPGTDAFKSAFITVGGIIYVVLPFALLHQLVVMNVIVPLYSPYFVLGLILLIWANDTFAYLWGSLFGRRKLLERVSPGKTWEGTIMGALTTFGCGFIICRWEGFAEGWFWPIAGLVVSVTATLGDLAESHLKRIAGVKDSGRILPGHGGVLDRFDSLLFVAPLAAAVMAIAKMSG
jgi:phosphatidate cytidylyltransferase